MSDNLRDRIAAVIASGRMDRSNYELADAVIAALRDRHTPPDDGDPAVRSDSLQSGG